MRLHLLIALAALLPLAGLTAKPAAATKDSPAKQQKMLLEFLGGGKKDARNWRLNRHWVGSYLKAKHDPRGSGLKIWFAAVRKFRANPDGALLKQLVARLDESESTGLMSIEIPEMIKTLFHDETATFEKDIGGWNAKKRQRAQALLLDALPEATNRESLEMAVELAIRETRVGPVKTDMDTLNVKPTRFEIPATIPRSSLDLETCPVRRAGEILRDEILGRWKKGK